MILAQLTFVHFEYSLCTLWLDFFYRTTINYFAPGRLCEKVNHKEHKEGTKNTMILAQLTFVHFEYSLCTLWLDFFYRTTINLGAFTRT